MLLRLILPGFLWFLSFNIFPEDTASKSVWGLIDKCRLKKGFTRDELQFLIKNDKTFNINAKENNDLTILHWCVGAGRIDEVNMLLENGAYVDSQANFQTPLLMAVRNGNYPMVWRLLKAGANKNLKDNHQLTPLDYANRSGNNEIIGLLGGKPSNLFIDQNRKEAYAILDKAEKGEISPTSFLGSFAPYGPLIDEPYFDGGMTIIHRSVGEPDTELLQAAIKLKANIDVVDFPEGNTPLHYAISLDNFAAVKVLTDAGASLSIKNANGNTPLDFAKERNKSNINFILTAFMDKKTKGDKNAQERIIAYLKSFKNSSKWKSKIKKHEKEINEINQRLVAEAAAKKPPATPPIVKPVSPPPAPISRPTPTPAPISRPTPTPAPQPSKVIPFPKLLEAAANSIESGNPKGLSWALDNGLPPDARLPNGNPIIHAACFYGNFFALQSLITRGANINNKGVDGFTPLMVAVRGYKYPLVEYLVKIGADRRVRNNFNWTAFDFARQNRDERLMFLTRF